MFRENPWSGTTFFDDDEIANIVKEQGAMWVCVCVCECVVCGVCVCVSEGEKERERERERVFHIGANENQPLRDQTKKNQN